MRGDAAGEVERRLGDRKRIAGVEANSDAANGFAEVDELVTAKILMVFDRQDLRPSSNARGPRSASAARTAPTSSGQPAPSAWRSPQSTVVRP